MVWEIIKYKKAEINKAGRILREAHKHTDENLDWALEVLNNFRAAHSYPLNVFRKRLKSKALKIDKNALIVQRLKRAPAIFYKLSRGYNGKKPSMELYQMQDIGGCRAVLKNLDMAKELYGNSYLKGELKHKLTNKKDYVNNPKPDGYRSFHLVYEYKSDKRGKKNYNGLLTEVQIRSKLQHIWATAVETVGLFTRQAIKTNEGSPEWVEFFKLVSSAFAMIENSPTLIGTPENKEELYKLISLKEKELRVINKMSSWTEAMRRLEEEIKSRVKVKDKKKVKFFLLELDIERKKLDILIYQEGKEQQAINDYSALEKKHTGNKDYDVVLVGANTTNDLKKAYPNYFVDTGEFISLLKGIINKIS